TGSGDRDVLIIDPSGGNPLPAGGFSFDGQGGADNVQGAADTNFTLSDRQLVIAALGVVNLTTVEQATLTGGPSDGNAFTLSDWSGAATINGAGGVNDVLAVHGRSVADVINVYSSAVELNGSNNAYSDIDSLTVYAREGNDTILIINTAAGVPVTINAGTGNDSIGLSSIDQNLDVIHSVVTVNGEGDVDSVFVQDQANGF